MDGLVPGIVQDARTGRCSCSASSTKPVTAGRWTPASSPSGAAPAKKLWMKGETSGNRLRIVTASTDCDNDALLFRVIVEATAVCHRARKLLHKLIAMPNSAEAR